MTGIGPVAVRQPRVRDRDATADNPDRMRFTPAILPPYARRSKSLEMLIPILYLKGISTGDFEEALAALLGTDAPRLSASTISRLKEVWVEEHKRASTTSRPNATFTSGPTASICRLGSKRKPSVSSSSFGATPEGKKELIGFTDGMRESAHDSRALLLDLKGRGLSIAPDLAIAYAPLGFWKALGELWPKTRERRCWVHKTG
jgi:transposase-like protein